MSATDFGAGVVTNTTRQYTTTVLTPLGDVTGWAVGAWVRHAAFAGNEVLVGFGVGAGASSFQLLTFGGGQYGAQVRDASGANVSSGANYPIAGDTLIVAQYSDANGSLETYVLPKGTTVSGPSDSTGAALATVTPGAGWYIGSDGTDWTKTPLGEIFVVNRRLTNAELTTLAAGAQITAVLTPQLYWAFRAGANATETNTGSVGASGNATRVGTGYTTTTDFFSVAGGGGSSDQALLLLL